MGMGFGDLEVFRNSVLERMVGGSGRLRGN